MKKSITLFALFLLMAMPASGEYYQYTDQNGELRFTDDLTRIPENQILDIKAFESVQVATGHNSPEAASESVSKQIQDNTSSSADTWEDKTRDLSEELDRMRVELKQTAESLRGQQEELEAQAPGKNASVNEKTAYAEKVNRLNARVEEYNEKRQVFNEKVTTVNRQIGLSKKREAVQTNQ